MSREQGLAFGVKAGWVSGRLSVRDASTPGAPLLPAWGEGLLSPSAQSWLLFLLWTSWAPQDWASGDTGPGPLLPKALGISSVTSSSTNGRFNEAIQ